MGVRELSVRKIGVAWLLAAVFCFALASAADEAPLTGPHGTAAAAAPACESTDPAATQKSLEAMRHAVKQAARQDPHERAAAQSEPRSLEVLNGRGFNYARSAVTAARALGVLGSATGGGTAAAAAAALPACGCVRAMTPL